MDLAASSPRPSPPFGEEREKEIAGLRWFKGSMRQIVRGIHFLRETAGVRGKWTSLVLTKELKTFLVMP
jgi:hypothetical protein